MHVSSLQRLTVLCLLGCLALLAACSDEREDARQSAADASIAVQTPSLEARRTANWKEQKARRRAAAQSHRRPLLQQLALLAKAQQRHYERKGFFFIPVESQRGMEHLENALPNLERVSKVADIQILPNRDGFLAIATHEQLLAERNCRLRIDHPPGSERGAAGRITCSWQANGKVWHLD